MKTLHSSALRLTLQHFVLPFFILLLSVSILGKSVPASSFITSSVDSLEESKQTVTDFTAAALGLSVAITFLPDDIGTSLADALTELDKYFILILAALFLEKLLVTSGVDFVFRWLLPAACILWMLSGLLLLCRESGFLRHKPYRDRFSSASTHLKNFAGKLAILSIALVLTVPCGTHLSNTVGAQYQEYVQQTITETGSATSTITEKVTEGEDDETILERVTGAVSSAIDGVRNLADYCKTALQKFMNSIAILLITTCVIPVLTFLFLLWIMKNLFTPPQELKLPEELRKFLEDKSHDSMR